MAEFTNISWADSTFNAWRGCTKISPGCAHCYAETMSGRNHEVLGEWGPHGTRPVAAESYWRQPEKWNREAEAESRRHRVFCMSLGDVFEGPETMPSDFGFPVQSHLDPPQYVPSLNNALIGAARERLFGLIDQTPHLDWLLLTKRPRHVMPLYGAWVHWMHLGRWPDNVWMGVSVEDQERAEVRLPVLCSIPARVRWISLEPLLEFVDLRPWLGRPNGVDWVVIGGESGPKHRAMEPDWVARTVDMCREAGVGVFVKQDSGSKPGKQGRIPLDVWLNKEFPAASRTT